jgi:hypothetical protein
MRFASIVYRAAAVWGLLVLVPFYFMFAGASDLATTFSYPQAYFGFLGVTLAWQVAFWVIGTDPARFRPLMPVTMLEKLAYIVAIVVLFSTGRVSAAQATSAIPDTILCGLFVVSWMKTKAT